MQRRDVQRIFVIVAFVTAAAVALALRAPLGRALLAGTIDLATGYRVAFDDASVGVRSAVFQGTRVSSAGVLLQARRIALEYDLGELVRGRRHRYGLLSLDIEAPAVTLERRRDGSFGTSGVAATGAAPQTIASDAAPLAFGLAVHDGSVTLVDPWRQLPNARRLEIRDVAARATVDSAARSSYRIEANLAGDRRQAFTVRGSIDAGRFAQHRVLAKSLDATALADYVINTPQARVFRATARDVDVRAYAFPAADGSLPYHLAGSATLADGAMLVPGLLPRARDMHGRIDVFDDGLAAPALAARLGPLDAVRLAGGLYGWNAPHFRLGLAAGGDLRDLRGLFTFSRQLPLAGPARLATLLEGATGSPLVATRIGAAHLRYGAFPIADFTGRAIYYARAVDVVGARGSYDGLAFGANGTIHLSTLTATQIVFDATGPAARVPYLAQAAPEAQVDAIGLVTGRGVRLDGRGAVAGTGGGTSLAGTFHVDPDGDGALGPLALTRADGGSLAGTFYLHRSAGESGFWLAGRNVPYAALATSPRLPGVALIAPHFGGRLDGELAGVGQPSAFRVAGIVHGRAVRVGSVLLDDVAGSVTGSLQNLALANVAARGPWGAFTGDGSYRGQRLALQGDYRGSFAELATFTGNLGATGRVDGPVALLVDPERTVVQTRGVATNGARVRGLPLDGAAGTLGVENGRLRIYAATAAIAGGTLAAAGGLNDGAGLGLSLGDANAAKAVSLAGVDPGRVTAIGRVSVARRLATFTGAAAVDGATVDRFPSAANADVALSASGLQIADGAARVGPAVGTLGGTVAGFGTTVPSYDFDIGIGEAELAPFAQALLPARSDIAGTGQARLRVRGARGRFAVAGAVAVPEGTVNGLSFGGLASAIGLAPGSFDAQAGTVTVGSTRTTFAGSFRGSEASLRVDAPHADLADFNDFFDAGDTLGGRGRIAARYFQHAGTVATNADIAIDGLRYRRFELGDARANWTSRGENVRGRLSFGGPSGTLATAGTLALAADAPLAEMAARSRFNGSARLRGLDLGVWLPALGYQLPLAGRIDADAAIAGPLRDPDFRTNATIVGGSIGAFPIDRLDVAASSTLRRTTIERAELDLPALAVAATGTLGFGGSDPLALRVHVKSSNLSALATRLSGAGGTVTGQAEADVKVEGTRGNPRISGGFDVEAASLRGVAVPRALGQFNLEGRDIVLSDAEVGFAAGRLDLAGSVPLEIAPFGFGPASAPIALELALRGIDLTSFAPLLPAGSTLAGRLDGQVAVAGNAGSPRFDGTLNLAGGTVRTPDETVPIENIAARVGFAGSTATLERLQASAGGGTLEARGSATFVDLVRPERSATYDVRATANRVHLNFPAYGSGQVDGFLTVAQRPRRIPTVGGDLSFSDATIPFSALASTGGGASGDGPAPLPLAFDFDVDADRNVRVRSANVDIGARGALHVAGTRAAPQLDGRFTSTGGTLTYFNTIFRLLDGAVTFSPDNGVVPTLDAHAVTHVIDPDPNTVRNAAGAADVTLAVTGPLTSLSIALSSDPAYDRQQILGLLLNAPALGASNLFGETSQNPTLYGSNSTAGLPPSLATNRNTSGQLSIAQEAFGVANAQFTRTLLAPIETSVAEAVGLSNFNVNVDYTGSVGVQARKFLGKKVNALFGTSFGYPYRQTFGFELKPNPFEAAQLTVFQTLGANDLNSLTPTTTLTGATTKLQAAQPSAGTIGFSFSLQRLFP